MKRDKCVEARIERLKLILEQQPDLPQKVFLVSTIKGKVKVDLEHLFACFRRVLDVAHAATDLN